eukprot:3006022-Pleurochrysis_carterae.AAC.1
MYIPKDPVRLIKVNVSILQASPLTQRQIYASGSALGFAMSVAATWGKGKLREVCVEGQLRTHAGSSYTEYRSKHSSTRPASLTLVTISCRLDHESFADITHLHATASLCLGRCVGDAPEHGAHRQHHDERGDDEPIPADVRHDGARDRESADARYTEDDEIVGALKHASQNAQACQSPNALHLVQRSPSLLPPDLVNLSGLPSRRTLTDLPPSRVSRSQSALPPLCVCARARARLSVCLSVCLSLARSL